MKICHRYIFNLYSYFYTTTIISITACKDDTKTLIRYHLYNFTNLLVITNAQRMFLLALSSVSIECRSKKKNIALTAAAVRSPYHRRGRRPRATLYIWRTMIWSGEVNGRARRGWAWAVIDPYWRWNVDQWARAAKFAAESRVCARNNHRVSMRQRCVCNVRESQLVVFCMFVIVILIRLLFNFYEWYKYYIYKL